MGAEVQALRRVPAGGIERQDARTGLLQSLDVFVIHRRRADGVDDGRDPDAAPGCPLERGSEFIGDLSGFVDVGLETDPAGRGVDGGKHRRKDRVAVREDVVAVAPAQRCVDQCRQILRIARILGSDVALQLNRFLILGEEERGRHHDNDRKQHRERSTARQHGHGARVELQQSRLFTVEMDVESEDGLPAEAREDLQRAKAGGEGGIRTLGRALKTLQRFSKPPLSATQPPHRGLVIIRDTDA